MTFVFQAKMKTIFLIDDAERYTSKVPGSAWISLFTSHFVNQEALRNLLKGEKSNTLVVSSKRSALAIVQANVEEHDLPILYCVGYSSQQVLGSRITRGNSKNSSDLAEILLEDWKQGMIATEEIVFLSGDKRMDTIPTALSIANIPFRELEVYRTERDKAGMIELVRNIREETDLLLVLFSPSGVDYLIESLGSDVPENWRSFVHFACIGETTNSALASHGLKAKAQAESPDPDAMAAAISFYVNVYRI
jgi:uroporphyrinogen-III synthase